MQKMLVDIPFNFTERDLGKDEKGDVNKAPTNVEQTASYIIMAVSNKYQQGLDGQWRRLWGRIQRKLDEAIDKEKKHVEFERSELEFIKRGFGEDVKLPAVASKYLMLVEDELEKALKEEDKAHENEKSTGQKIKERGGRKEESEQ